MEKQSTIPTVHKLAPAFDIVEQLGGKGVVAKAVKLDRSAVTRWCMASPKGTGGMIPQRHWPALMRLATRRGVPLTLEALAGIKM